MDYLTQMPTFKEAKFQEKIKIIFIILTLPFHVFWRWLKKTL